MVKEHAIAAACLLAIAVEYEKDKKTDHRQRSYRDDDLLSIGQFGIDRGNLRCERFKIHLSAKPFYKSGEISSKNL
ncbi:hypothetical protein D3C81_2260090 [compost metagenome]